MPRRTKQHVLDDITAALATSTVVVSTGSTEPKQVLEAIVSRFGLHLDTRLSKPELAEAIAHAAGLAWHPTFDSRHTPSGGGSTITLDGLERLLEAVRRLRG